MSLILTCDPKAIVKNRLAGCIQLVGPIVSTYWWRGNVETAEEWLCFIKTKKDLYEELEESIKKVHPYGFFYQRYREDDDKWWYNILYSEIEWIDTIIEWKE